MSSSASNVLGPTFLKPLVPLQGRGDGCQRRFTFDLEPAFDQSLHKFFCVHRAIRLAEHFVRGFRHAFP